MAEKKGVGHAFNIDFLNVVFAASSVFLLLSVVWMVWDDFDRDWKNTQRRFVQLETQVTRAKLQQLQTQLKSASQNVSGNQAKVDELDKKLKDLDNRLYRVTADYQTAK